MENWIGIGVWIVMGGLLGLTMGAIIRRPEATPGHTTILVVLNLALLNLLPIPVLDGGHLLFIFIEIIRFGKPLSPQQRMRLIQVGLFIVLALMIFATANDLRRVFG